MGLQGGTGRIYVHHSIDSSHEREGVLADNEHSCDFSRLWESQMLHRAENKSHISPQKELQRRVSQRQAILQARATRKSSKR